MTLWSPIAVLTRRLARTGDARLKREHLALQAERARRWREAFARNPALAEDVVRLSGLLMLDDAAPLTPEALAHAAGARALAVELLALMEVRETELLTLLMTTRPNGADHAALD